MSTSGTVGQTVISTAEFIEQALTMCGLKAAQITPETVRKAKIALFMYLCATVNTGVNLWTIENQVLGCIPGNEKYPLPMGSVDELTVNYRRPVYANNASGFTSSDGGITQYLVDDNVQTAFVQNSSNGTIAYNYSAQQRVQYFMLMSYGQGYYSLIAETSQDGAAWTTVQTYDRFVSCPDLEWVQFKIDTPHEAQYFRVRETNGAILSLRLLTITNGGNDIPVQRVNLPDYSNMTDKNGQGGQTTMFWVNRRLKFAELVIWPVPNVASDQISVYYHRQIQDVGSLQEEIEIPDRWFQTVLEGYALKALFQTEGADLSRYPLLKAEYQKSLMDVESEERDKAPQQMLPNIRCYTC